ncbi:Golgi CORVET complex core vacuolar protein 8-domain-containing protein [Aspergillus pseudodeflectus]|uniref:Golgi CORVET complex core vacuolar protein 8-domain-containing protein n=1 Tax=Aspergillus pseudodeflectus TaxID=176178 RepID=A0ABR4KPH0_9EURO
MSSTIEGRDDRAREDDPDLGPADDDEQLPEASNGVNGDGTREEGLEDNSMAHIEEDIPDLAGQNHASIELPESPRAAQLGPSDSVDEIGSNPDDTPSLRGSILSTPSSSALAFRGSPRPSPSPSHRPFDLRFQSRLSSSSPGSIRPSSPFLTKFHSRKSSLTSRLSPATIESDPDLQQEPWEVVRWTKLRKITGQAFSEVGKRNFGSPTCMVVSTSIVIGTSRGIILVFDYQQSLRAVIGPGTKAVECGAIQSLALSADHSTVAGGHDSGDIFTWEISRPARPFLHIQPIPANQIETRTSDGHIARSPVIHLGFLGTRRTALVSADKRGMAFSHLATRGMGAMGRTVKTTRVLGRYPQPTVEAAARPRKPSSVLAFAPLPLGNVEQTYDSLGLVAMLTPYLLVIVSTTPVAQTQHKSARPKEVAAHGAMTGALAWFPAIKLKGKDSETSKTKLVYCWSNVLTVMDVSEVETDDEPSRDRPPSLEFRPRCRWRADEAIVAVQWLSRSVLAVLTITQQMLILEDHTMRVTNAVDLLNRHIYHVDLFSAQLHSLVEQFNEQDTSMHGVVADAFYMSFRSYKGRLFMLGHNEMQIGSLSNWADRLLALMEAGDFIGAIRQATAYYSGNSEKLTVGLPDEDALRQPIVREKLLEMVSASLKYAFGRNTEASNDRLDRQQLEELAEVSLSACVCMAEEDFLWDEVFNWYEEHDSQGIFIDALEPFIHEGTVLSLPPTAVKALINHFILTHTASQLEEIICLLDTSTMDIDQVTTLCKQHNLYDAFIYVWNRCLGDYIGPLQELMRLIPSQHAVTNGDSVNELKQYTNAMKVFPYLSFILTSRSYPTGNDMAEDEAFRAKATVYDYLFSGNQASNTTHSQANGTFSALEVLLQFDTSSFMSMLNEAFEDSFLNEQDPDEVVVPHQGVSINRQYLISILLQTLTPPTFDPSDTIYLDIFIARNLPKYPQYILLSGSTLHQVLQRLCQYPNEEMAEDCQLSAEYLLSIYHPPDVQQMIPLFRKARFFRILKSTYKSEKQYPELILTFLEDPSEKDRIFTCLQDCLRPGSNLGKKQRQAVISVIETHAREIATIDVQRAAKSMRDFAPETHGTFIKALQDDTYGQYEYLTVVVERMQFPTTETRELQPIGNWMVERYVQLLCKYEPAQVANFVDALREGDIRLEELLPSMEESGVVDAAVVLLARQGQVRAAMDRLIAHLKTLESGLVGILQSVQETPDSASTAEAIDDLMESLNKYAKVGTWLCQGQSKTPKTARNIIIQRNGKAAKNNALEQPLSFDEELWLDLLEGVVRIASSVFGQIQRGIIANGEAAESVSPLGNNASQLVSSFRTLVQQVFTILLSSTVRTSGPAGPPTGGERNDVAFLRILRAFLTRAVRWSPSLLELRAVLASVFSAYTYEKSLLSLANGMLDRDLFVHVEQVTRLRQRGWRPRGQVCEVCRQRIWGPGVGPQHWHAWETRQNELEQHRLARQMESRVDPASARGKGKAAAVAPIGQPPHHLDGHVDPSTSDHGLKPANEEQAGATPGPVVVFSCRHLYHRQCLLDLGQSQPPRRRQHHVGEWEMLACAVCPVHSE